MVYLAPETFLASIQQRRHSNLLLMLKDTASPIQRNSYNDEKSEKKLFYGYLLSMGIFRFFFHLVTFKGIIVTHCMEVLIQILPQLWHKIHFKKSTPEYINAHCTTRHHQEYTSRPSLRITMLLLHTNQVSLLNVMVVRKKRRIEPHVAK